MKRLLVVVICLSALAYPQDRLESVARLERCIREVARDVRAGGKDCRGKALERVLAFYDAGDLSLLPLILRAHNLSFAGRTPDPGNVYMDIFERRPQPFLSALDTLSPDDQDAVIYAFSDVSLRVPMRRVEATRRTLGADSSAVGKRLLYAVEMRNAFRITQYFPAGTFSGRFDDSDRLIQRQYSANLFALGEPPIYSEKQAPGNSVYRFLWVRAFGDPVSVRLAVMPDGRGIATLKVSHRPEVEPRILTNKETALDASDVSAFLALLAGANFWDQPTSQESNGRDGAEWIIEANDGARYHVVDRWSPKTGPYREAALLLLKKSGFPLKEDTSGY